MRSPNELGASVVLNPERFSGTERIAWDGASQSLVGGAYSEDVFQYFLDIERRRSSVSGQPFLLLVISSLADPEEVIPSPVADGVFAALSKSVRDTDFVGWYAQGKAIGAVLIQAVDPAKVDVAGRVSARVSNALAAQLPVGLVDLLRLRLCLVRAEREVWI